MVLILNVAQHYGTGSVKKCGNDELLNRGVLGDIMVWFRDPRQIPDFQAVIVVNM